MAETSPLAGLGRLVQRDKRNANYPLPKMKVPAGVRYRYWNSGGIYDQGSTPQCVGYAGYGWLRGGPVVNVPTFNPTDLYNWAQERDEWSGTDYDGTSTLGLMKALKDKGYIDQYQWAWDVETLVNWVLTTGPVVVGTNWYMDMFMPIEANDFLEIGGPNVGGHEWRIIGVNKDKRCPDGTRGALRMANSWGYGWGDQGRAWISYGTMQRLLDEDGEAVTAPEIKAL